MGSRRELGQGEGAVVGTGVWVVACGVLSLSCHHARNQPDVDAGTAVAPATVTAATASVDRVLDGELAPGDEDAFGIALPRGMKAKLHFADFVVAVADVRIDRLVEYLQARVTAARITTSTSGVTMEGVTVKSQPGKVLTIEIRPHAGRTELQLQDVSPPQVPPDASTEERWRRAGLYPDGRLVDPQHME